MRKESTNSHEELHGSVSAEGRKILAYPVAGLGAGESLGGDRGGRPKALGAGE